MDHIIMMHYLNFTKMPRNIILNSLKESFSSIWKNKPLFTLLFILQIVFFISFSLISYNSTSKILESAQAITEYLSQQKLDELSVADSLLGQKSILGEDPLLISRNFSEMVKNFRAYLIYIFILLIASISAFWTLTLKLVHKINFKYAVKIFIKIFAISIFYLGLIFLFFFSIFNISFAEAAVDGAKIFSKYIPFLIFSIILAYFMFISLSLAHSAGWKNIAQKTLIIGIKKAHYILAAYLIIISLLAVSVISLAYFIEKNLFVLLLSITLMIFSFVFGRIFVVKVVERLD